MYFKQKTTEQLGKIKMQNDTNNERESHSETINVRGELSVKWRKTVVELALLLSGKNSGENVDEFTGEINLDTAEILCSIPTNGCCLNKSSHSLKNWISKFFIS